MMLNIFIRMDLLGQVLAVAQVCGLNEYMQIKLFLSQNCMM